MLRGMFSEIRERLEAGYTLPAGWYSDSAILALERERIFKHTWQYACVTAEVAEPGDYYATRAGHIPVVLVRDKDGNLNGFVNVCRHRGHVVMGVSLLLVFSELFTFIHTGTVAQILGHVTFSISFVVVIVRGRLFSIGRQYEEAAADLGASPFVALTRVLLPLLTPAIVASAAVVFAISADDFVISQWLSEGGPTDTVPIRIYSATRAAPLPSVNAIATIMCAQRLGGHRGVRGWGREWC